MAYRSGSVQILKQMTWVRILINGYMTLGKLLYVYAQNFLIRKWVHDVLRGLWGG